MYMELIVLEMVQVNSMYKNTYVYVPWDEVVGLSLAWPDEVSLE